MSDTLKPPAAAGMPDDEGPHRGASDLSRLPIFTPASKPPAVPAVTPEAAGPGSSAPADVSGAASIDWSLVMKLMEASAEELGRQLADYPGITEQARQDLGTDVITALVAAMNRDNLNYGKPGLTPQMQAALIKAVWNEQFGLGRLQEHIDKESVDNIHVMGFDRVRLTHSSGRIEYINEPIADSNDALVRDIGRWVSRTGGNRTFSIAERTVKMAIPGSGHRFTAFMASQVPSIAIRRHRFVDIDLNDLANPKDPTMTRMISPHLAAFLAAAVRAGMSIVVAGETDSAKTTMLRAILAALDPDVSLATVETERELQLHSMPERHRWVASFESQPGSSEMDENGEHAGEHSIDALLEDTLKGSYDLVILGEVVGKEINSMFKAMQQGAGSLCTIHAHSCEATIERIVTLAMESGGSPDYALRQIGQHINLIVHLRADTPPPAEDGTPRPKQRWVAEVCAINGWEAGRPLLTHIYVPGENGRAEPNLLPSSLREKLARHGAPMTGWRGETR